jgi:hypothetical protein
MTDYSMQPINPTQTEGMGAGRRRTTLTLSEWRNRAKAAERRLSRIQRLVLEAAVPRTNADYKAGIAANERARADEMNEIGAMLHELNL